MKTEVDDISTFTTWLSRSKSGEAVTYHYGNLMRDRLLSARGGKSQAGGQLDKLAKAALKAADGGYVALFQKRVDEGMCQYLAVKR
jgi:hypothetical protein